MPLDPYDYLRIQIQMDFQCQRCGTCCQVADPIDIYPKDIRRLPSFFNNSKEEAIEEYTIPHPSEPDLWAFKIAAPCRFYDELQKECKLYQARPMVCRCNPFLSPDQIGLRAWRSTRIAPPQIKVIKELKGIWKSCSNPNSRTKKKLEKALAKMMQIEMTDHSQFQN
jgi:Fe-S-cluster containining protein